MSAGACDDPTWHALPSRPGEAPTAAARAAAVARLESWAAARGARFEALEVRVDAAGNASAQARRPIGRGEPIVTIPRALMLADRDVGASSPGELAAWLALEAARLDSPWRPFLEVMPARFADMPVFRGGDELAPIAGTTARLLAAEAHRETLAAYAALPDHVRARVPLAAYAWGRAVVQSRGFNAPFTIDPSIAFIPIVDLMDHARGETTWRYDVAGARYVVTASRDFAAGEAVHLDYGAYGNARLLVDYGFALPDNPDDETVLVLAGEPFLVAGPGDGRLADLRETFGWRAIARAAASAIERLDRLPDRPPAASGSWHASCALVRAGERRTLARIVAWAERSCDNVQGRT